MWRRLPARRSARRRYHAVDRRCTELKTALRDAPDTPAGEALILELNTLFAERNEHGCACNDAMAIAIRFHGEILEILREAGFEHEWLLENPSPNEFIH